MKIHWARVVIAAFVIEFVLIVTLVPIGQVFGLRVFLITVPIGVFVGTFLLTAWFCRRIQSRLALHGLLVGLVATIIYLGLVIGSGQMSEALATYGPVLFVVGNGLRILAAVLGAMFSARRRQIA